MIRHPGYLGSLLTWTGFALTSRSLPTITAVGGLLGVAYGRRITAEEQMLQRDLPGYDELVFRMEDPDGLILGVVRVGDEQRHARFDQYRGKWSYRMSKQARKRVEDAWTAEEQRTFYERLEQVHDPR